MYTWHTFIYTYSTMYGHILDGTLYTYVVPCIYTCNTLCVDILYPVCTCYTHIIKVSPSLGTCTLIIKFTKVTFATGRVILDYLRALNCKARHCMVVDTIGDK